MQGVSQHRKTEVYSSTRELYLGFIETVTGRGAQTLASVWFAGVQTGMNKELSLSLDNEFARLAGKVFSRISTMIAEREVRVCHPSVHLSDALW